MTVELNPSNFKELLLLCLRLRRRVRVTGASMSPLLQQGDEVLVDPKAYRHKIPQPDDIVIAWHPYHANLKIIKRVIAITEDGRCYLKGDNPTESTDSLSFGTIPPGDILGRVTSRFA